MKSAQPLETLSGKTPIADVKTEDGPGRSDTDIHSPALSMDLPLIMKNLFGYHMVFSLRIA